MIGKHDFKAFTTAKKSKSTVRDIKDGRDNYRWRQL